MPKFKVGDLVVPRKGHYEGFPVGSAYNIPRVPHEVVDSGDYFIVVRGAAPWSKLSPPMNPNFWELAPSPSAIRTVTRREIVPGRYGNVGVGTIDEQGLRVGFWGYMDHSYIPMDAEELRETAKLFNELADVLDENAEPTN